MHKSAANGTLLSMSVMKQIFTIARIEVKLCLRHPKLLIAVLAVAFIPALYAVIYLSSVWDPAAKTGNLAVALVNLDRGMEYREHSFSVGHDVVARLKARHLFGYRDFEDEALAREQVRQGKLAFALIIPGDFSSNAVPGALAGAGKLVVYTSEGNSYQSAGLARRFAEDLGHEVNESLNERRWALVLSGALGSQQSMDRLREGVAQLRSGASELVSGSQQSAAGAQVLAPGTRKLALGVGQLTGGVKELGAGLRTMDARRPRNSELNRLKAGAETLAGGHAELGLGLTSLKDGSQRLVDGLSQARSEVKSSLFASPKVTEGVEQLVVGAAQLDIGLQAAASSQKRLGEGADQLSVGVGALTGGVQALTGGVRKMIAKLPDDQVLDDLTTGATKTASGTQSLADGMRKVSAGAERLASGLRLLANLLPAGAPRMDGSAEGLANSVQPLMEVDASVMNNGAGLAPNIISAALWLGAGIAAFLIHVRLLPRPAVRFSRPAKMLGKIAVPTAVVLLQALLVLLLVTVVLKIQLANPRAFALTLVVSSGSFLLIVFALTRAFGDAGKALAMIFLAVQLSSSGGILPVELSGGVFADISPWLPLTWVVRALKSSMFGAFDGAWQEPVQLIAVTGICAAVVATYVGRWRYVRLSTMRPAVEF